MEPAAMVLIVLLAVGFSWIVLAGRRRRLQRAFLAGRLRLRYTGQDTIGLGERLAGLYLMQLGHAGQITNILYGRRGTRNVFAFDYRYEAGAGTDRQVRRYTVVGCYEEAEPATYLPAVVALREEELRPLGVFRNYQAVPGEWAGMRVFSDNPEQGRRVVERLGKLPEMNFEFWRGILVFDAEEELDSGQIARLLTRCRRARREI